MFSYQTASASIKLLGMPYLKCRNAAMTISNQLIIVGNGTRSAELRYFSFALYIIMTRHKHDAKLSPSMYSLSSQLALLYDFAQILYYSHVALFIL